jgi:hypothetical protein
MSSDDLARHILYVSGQKDTKQNRTGARTIIDILLAAKLLEEKDGRLVVSSASEASAPKARNLEGELEFGEKRDMERVDTVRSISRPVQPDISPTIAINIQLQLPETENSEVYEKLFRALRKHLIDHDE